MGVEMAGSAGEACCRHQPSHLQRKAAERAGGRGPCSHRRHCRCVRIAPYRCRERAQRSGSSERAHLRERWGRGGLRTLSMARRAVVPDNRSHQPLCDRLVGRIQASDGPAALARHLHIRCWWRRGSDKHATHDVHAMLVRTSSSEARCRTTLWSIGCPSRRCRCAPQTARGICRECAPDWPPIAVVAEAHHVDHDACQNKSATRNGSRTTRGCSPRSLVGFRSSAPRHSLL